MSTINDLLLQHKRVGTRLTRAQALDSLQERVDCQEGGVSRSRGGAGASRSGERGGASRSGGAEALERLQERVDYEERAQELDWLQERVRNHTLTLAPTLLTNSQTRPCYKAGIQFIIQGA